MPRLQLRMRCLPRGEALADDEHEGNRLRELVVGAVERGGAPLVGVCLRSDRLDILALQSLQEARIPLPMFLAGLSRSEAEGAGAVEAVGLMGVVAVRAEPAGPPPAPMALAFLEWSDCRWWSWRAPVDREARVVLDDNEVVTRAVDGDPLPRGLGRWWSLGRRTGARVRIGPVERRDPAIEASPLVH